MKKILITLSILASSIVLYGQVGAPLSPGTIIQNSFLSSGGGTVTGNIIPSPTNTWTLGDATHFWSKGYFTNLTIAAGGGIASVSRGSFANSGDGEWTIGNEAGTNSNRIAIDHIYLSHSGAGNAFVANGAGIFLIANEAQSIGFTLNGSAANKFILNNIANNARATFDTGDILLNGVIADSITAPTIASGGCTSPAVTSNNGTAAFLITIGTSCSGVKTFTLTMPAAAHFWSCGGDNNTSDAAQQTNYMVARATSTTAVVVTSYDRVTGLQEDFTASNTYLLRCRAE